METKKSADGLGNRDALVASLKAAREKHQSMKTKAEAHLREKLTQWLERFNLSAELEVGDVSVDLWVKLLAAPDLRDYRASIDVYFRPDPFSGWSGEGLKRRFLEVSFNSVRLAVGRREDALMAKAAGMFAERVAEIEADLLEFAWDDYDEAEREMRSANDALRRYETMISAAEYERKAQAVRSKLGRGVRIHFFARSVYQGGDSVGTIEWISPKCVFFAGGRVKRATIPETLKMLVRGDWRIVE